MPSSFWHFFFTILGTIFLVGILITPFTLFVAATIVRQRRSPASSVTWLLTILLMPLIGIPLFWLFGTRKIERSPAISPLSSLRHRTLPVRVRLTRRWPEQWPILDARHYARQCAQVSCERRGGVRRSHSADRWCTKIDFDRDL